MKKRAYPDWVYQYRTKGTSIKKVGENYYLYRTTSKRVPGKRYPVASSKYIGVITKDGIVTTDKKKLSISAPTVYEYGFSYALDYLAYEHFKNEYGRKENARYAFLQLLKKHSPNSWFLQEEVSPTDLHLNVSLQEKKIERIIGRRLQDITALKYIYVVVVDGHAMVSEISSEAQLMLDELGVKLNEPEK